MKQINYIFYKNDQLSIQCGKKCYTCLVDMEEFIEYCCRMYGTSLANNRLLCKGAIKASQNLPICFSLANDIFYIPTKAINNKKCVLINCDQILDWEVSNSKLTRIHFHDGTQAEFECSTGTISMQMARAMQIRSYYSRNISPIMKLRLEHVII